MFNNKKGVDDLSNIIFITGIIVLVGFILWAVIEAKLYEHQRNVYEHQRSSFCGEQLVGFDSIKGYYCYTDSFTIKEGHKQLDIKYIPKNNGGN